MSAAAKYLTQFESAARAGTPLTTEEWLTYYEVRRQIGELGSPEAIRERLRAWNYETYKELIEAETRAGGSHA